MHGHDRTLLAQLGFADPDKKNYLHDMACQYLNVDRLYAMILARMKRNKTVTIHSLKVDCLRTETYIKKGEGKYSSTIGFADITGHLLLDMTTTMPIKRVCGNPTAESQLTEVSASVCSDLLVEVKIGHVGVGDVIRQLKLYREHFAVNARDNGVNACCPCEELYSKRHRECETNEVQHEVQVAGYATRLLSNYSTWLITAFSIDNIDAKTLWAEEINHAHLGPGFEEYVKARKSTVNIINDEV